MPADLKLVCSCAVRLSWRNLWRNSVCLIQLLMSSSSSIKKISRKTKKIRNSSWIMIKKKGNFPSSCLIIIYQVSSEKRTNLHLEQVAAHRWREQASHHVFTADFCKDTVVTQNKPCGVVYITVFSFFVPSTSETATFRMFFFFSTSLIDFVPEVDSSS